MAVGGLPPTPIPSSYGLSRGIRNIGHQLFYLFQGPSGTIKSEKLIEIKSAPLLLPLLAAAIYLHERGQETAQHEEGSNKKWFKIALESTVATVLINNTIGIYPLIGVGKGIYEAGEQKTALKKLQAFSNSVITFLAGYVGVQLGTGLFVEAPIETEERGIARCLSDDSFRNIFKNHAKPEMKTVGQTLEQFHLKYAELQAKAAPGVSFDLAEIKALKQELAVIKEKAFKELSPLLTTAEIKTAFPLGSDLMKGLEKLFTRLETSQQGYIQLGRKVTPICCYFLATALVGIPLARYFNRKLAEWLPHLKKKKVPKLHIPQNNLIAGDISKYNPFAILSGGAHGESAGGGH